MKKIVIASNNKGKIAEFKQLFEPNHIKVLSLADLPVDVGDIEETGDTFHKNAQIKAEAVARIIDVPVIADDSGLVVDELGGRPGVYSARYAGEPTDDVKNYEKLLTEMANVAAENRSARFVAVLALARPGGQTVFFEGHCEGSIAFEARGEFGFGYDPVFIPDGFDKTMAQLDQTTKNKISHRFHALEKLNLWLHSNKLE